MSCSRPVYALIVGLIFLCIALIAIIIWISEHCEVDEQLPCGSRAGSTTQQPVPTTQPPDDSVPRRINSEPYGALQDRRNATRYTLRNDHMTVKVLNYGGIISQIRVPGTDNRVDDVVLGYDNIEDYERDPHLLGAIVGRYANMIAGNTFRLDGDTYSLNVTSGFSKRLWNSAIKGDALVLTYVSPDDEDGFPGNVNVTVTYELTSRNELIITYRATTSKATVINLTNRSFFDLAGHETETVKDHSVRIDADFYTPLDKLSIPTGDTVAVDGTMYDVRANTLLGPRLPQVPGGRGFDTNFALKRSGWDKHMASRDSRPRLFAQTNHTHRPPNTFLE